MSLRGLLLDSGDTLIGPRGGRWNPRFDFESVLRKHWPGAPQARFSDAFAVGKRFMDEYGTTPPRDLYHLAILRSLGMEQPSSQLLAELNAPLAPAAVVEVFADVPQALESFRSRGLKMAVVSDSWAGLDRTFEALGLRDYFTAFVISEVVGCRKPDPRMYATASAALGLDPAECLYVDDDPALVRAAIDGGYGGIAIDRKGVLPTGDIPTIATLLELVDLLPPAN